MKKEEILKDLDLVIQCLETNIEIISESLQEDPPKDIKTGYMVQKEYFKGQLVAYRGCMNMIKGLE